MTGVILSDMKTAISVPDALFFEADRFAKRRAMSRSELYTKAVKAYLRQEECVTEELNAIFEAGDDGLDPLLQELQHRTLREDTS
jgi:metal-responsive CopG/Arc/MetJ family transcriptional regulator